MLTGFEIIGATRTAGTYASGYPWRLVLHRTQGATLAGAVGAYLDHQGWPHITASYAERRKAQHIELGTAARALKNLPGGTETNLARAVQVELTGFSQTPMSDAEADWVADEVIAPIIAEVPVGLHGPRFYDDDEGITLATPASPIRMDRAGWAAFDGICGHQHVPENDHWDPGRIPLDRIIARLSPHQEDSMSAEDVEAITSHVDKRIDSHLRPYLVKLPDQPHVFVNHRNGNLTWVDTPAMMRAVRLDGVAHAGTKADGVTPTPFENRSEEHLRSLHIIGPVPPGWE